MPDNPVEVTLQLVIEQLDEESRRLLPRLGVFQGGAMEDVLLEITEIKTEEWSKLRPLLETIGLIQVETLPNISVSYLQFHPSLTTALQLDNQDNLRHRYQFRYYELSSYLYHADYQNPIETRAIVKRELPNSFFAVKGALAKATDYAVRLLSIK
ncbi:Tetratricopeptide TPR_2 [Beggiatoa sp. PS]|nr:Tetratricopeptide TPR_2 [Beggiatoa sp. PS]